MNKPQSQTIEQVLFEKMGVSVEDAFATGADFVDEKVSAAAEHGADLEPRFDGLLSLLKEVTQPDTLASLSELVQRLPQLVQLMRLADEIPSIIAALADAMDDFQKRCQGDGIDVEKSIANGIHAALFLTTHIEKDDLERLGQLLKSEIFSHNAISVISNAANSLASAQQNSTQSRTPDRVGVFGLIGLLRNPDIQRSIAFAAKFGERFGKNMD